MADRERYEWLIGATVKELGFKPGTDVLTMMWVEKDEIRAVITLRPELVYDPEHNDGCQGSAKPDQSDGQDA